MLATLLDENTKFRISHFVKLRPVRAATDLEGSFSSRVPLLSMLSRSIATSTGQGVIDTRESALCSRTPPDFLQHPHAKREPTKRRGNTHTREIPLPSSVVGGLCSIQMGATEIRGAAGRIELAPHNGRAQRIEGAARQGRRRFHDDGTERGKSGGKSVAIDEVPAVKFGACKSERMHKGFERSIYREEECKWRKREKGQTTGGDQRSLDTNRSNLRNSKSCHHSSRSNVGCEIKGPL